MQSFQWNESVRSTELTQRDYSFIQPKYNQQQQVSRQREGGEHGDYGLYNSYGRYKEDDSGQRFTQYQLEGLRNDASTGQGQSNGMHLSAGHRFSLTENPTEYLNRPYLVIAVTHSGQQPQALEEHAGEGATTYGNQFLVHAESEYSWRPRQKHKPMVDGPQIAHVVGPEGEEIYTDEYGRVKLHFPWDRYSNEDDKSSCWVRVSQAWAGTRFGAIAIPRIGQEVIVDYLEGDPDQPIVTGRTYHAVNMPPYELPANKTQTGIKTRSSQGGDSGTFNELRFEDKKGQEQVYIHAEKNQDNVVENDETTEVGRDRTEHVGRNETITIDHDRTETVHHNETITIDNNRTESVGVNESISIGSNRDESVGNNESVSIGSNQSLKVGKSQSISVGKTKTENIKVANLLTVGAGMQVAIGLSMNTSVGASSSEQVGLVKHVLAGKQIQLVCGDSSLTLYADGKIALKGKEIEITGANSIKMNGEIIDLN